jgi:hypothetical protein
MDWRETGALIRERGRQFLSDYVEPAKFHRPSYQRLSAHYAELDFKNGRPREETSRSAATIAFYFYEAWREENQKHKVNDYGHREEMKDYAAEAVVEDMFAWLIESKYAWRLGKAKTVSKYIDIVRDLMGKSASRRDPGEFAELDFPASDQGAEFPPKPFPI